jgi:hypothetical protein
MEGRGLGGACGHIKRLFSPLKENLPIRQLELTALLGRTLIIIPLLKCFGPTGCEVLDSHSCWRFVSLPLLLWGMTVQKLVHENTEVMLTAAKYYRRPSSCELWAAAL